MAGRRRKIRSSNISRGEFGDLYFFFQCSADEVIDASDAEQGFGNSIPMLSKRDAEVMTDRAADDRLAYQRVLPNAILLAPALRRSYRASGMLMRSMSR
jgi:hypothetical protein